jgi:hypothetical protein
MDHNTLNDITVDPMTYRTGDMNVVFVSDNFATAVITTSIYPIEPGVLAVTRSADVENYEKMIRDKYLNNAFSLEDDYKAVDNADQDMLYDVDVELNIDDLNEELGEDAATIRLTEDEIRELNRREREKSVIDGFDPDVEQIEALEDEILRLEQAANEEKEKAAEESETEPKEEEEDIFETIDNIEDQVGRKYMREDLNSKENFYGLTEYDIEEMDELFEASDVENKQE